MIRILLIEDEPMWQEGIRALLSVEPDMELVGVANNADDGEALFKEHWPDCVLVDWKIQGKRDGLEMAEMLSSQIPAQNIIVVSGSPADQLPEHLPYSYVCKAEIADQLVPTIRRCVNSSYLSGNS